MTIFYNYNVSMIAQARGRRTIVAISPRHMTMANTSGVTLGTASLALSALIGTSLPAAGADAQAGTDSSAACPTVTPLHGLLPFLMWIGIFPRPVMASTVAASDTSTSLVIRPDPNDQITCGKTSWHRVLSSKGVLIALAKPVGDAGDPQRSNATLWHSSVVLITNDNS